MALIQCPECGKEISDRASSCPNCGYPILPMADEVVEQPAVPEVEPAPEGSGDSLAAASDDMAVSPSPAANRKKLIIPIVAVLAVIIAVVAIVIPIQNGRKAKAARAEYISALSEFRYKSLDGAADAETQCNLTLSVWHDAIYKEDNTATHRYTHNAYGDFVDDFNDALFKLSVATKDERAAISENQDEVSRLYQALLNPPEDSDLTACFDLVDKMYDEYKKLTDLAVSPQGSLTSYSADFRAADTNFIDYYEKLKLLIPEE